MLTSISEYAVMAKYVRENENVQWINPSHRSRRLTDDRQLTRKIEIDEDIRWALLRVCWTIVPIVLFTNEISPIIMLQTWLLNRCWKTNVKIQLPIGLGNELKQNASCYSRNIYMYFMFHHFLKLSGLYGVFTQRTRTVFKDVAVVHKCQSPAILFVPSTCCAHQ